MLLAALVATAGGAGAAIVLAPDRTSHGNTEVATDARPAPTDIARAWVARELRLDATALRPMRPTTMPAVTNAPVRNFGTRTEGLQPVAIVLHATGGGAPGSGYRTLRELHRRFDGTVHVSAHYGIDRAGRVMRYVDDESRAWHTAARGWNDVSIGIELLNSNSGVEPFPPAQIKATQRLVRALGTRYDIPAQFVVRHRDVQPWDRSDPAGNFPWQRFRTQVVRQAP